MADVVTGGSVSGAQSRPDKLSRSEMARASGDGAQRLWLDVLTDVRVRVNPEGFETWLAPTRAVEFDVNGLVVEVPNSFFADWLGQHYVPELRSALARASGRDVALSFRARDAADAKALSLRYEYATRAAVRTNGGGGLSARYTFDNFVVGESSRFACAAARSVAERPGRTYNPLFIYGGTGLGKTHLLEAIGNRALAVHRNVRVHCVAAESLFIELIQAIERNTRLEFKSKYRGLDLLLLDDVHYLVGKERLQEEVFHIFNHLHESGSQVVFTSDREPREIPTLEQRLVSRLGSGLVVDIQLPELETRIAILQQKAAAESCELPHDVACYIAGRVKTSVRELEGSLVRLLAMASLDNAPLSVALAERALADLVRDEAPPDEGEICRRAAAAFGVTVADIRNGGRTKQLALARQVTMYLMRRKRNLSLSDIGRALGGKDHTTVMHAVNKIEKLRVKDPGFAARLRKLEGAGE